MRSLLEGVRTIMEQEYIVLGRGNIRRDGISKEKGS